MSHFVLEIGTEEIPARFLGNIEKELVARFNALLGEHKLAFERLEAATTPRRSILHIFGLEKVQAVSEEIASGPSINIAYDANGELTKAGAGFLRGQGVDASEVFTVKTDKGEYIAVRKQVGGKKAEDVLAEICPAIISALPFAKRMRWGSDNFAYARPMHWIVALLDSEIVPFKVGLVQSSNKTYGHRIHGIGPFTISHADNLEDILFKKGHVVCRAEKRRAIIQEEGAEAAEHGRKIGTVLWNDTLLDEVQGLVERPVPLVGYFDESFLELPKEVLLTSMQHHQKCFGIVDEDGELLPEFLTVLNVVPENISVVRQGWERVLRARLEDGRFYWKTDLQASFDTWIPMLDKVIFLGPLGTMGDKTRRLEKLCAWLVAKLSIEGVSTELAERVGRWSKADLVSQMVGEFDTLQGIMGGIYARKAGHEEAFALALSEQYLPSGVDSPLPTSHLGAIVSIADKADTLVGCFGIGNIPTGAADPYALRRAALGIIRILKDFGYALTLTELFDAVYACYAEDIKWKFSKEATIEKLIEFMNIRLKNYFVGEGSDTLVVEAIMTAKNPQGALEADMVYTIDPRLQALKNAMQGSNFLADAQTFKRVSNILAKHDGALQGVWDEKLFEHESEEALARCLVDFANAFDRLWAENKYQEIFALMDGVRPQVDAFFDGVMVMAEDLKVRENRFNILYSLMSRMGRIADFSNLQI